MRYATKIATLALAAMVLVAGSADSKKDKKKNKKKSGKWGAFAECGAETDLSRQAWCYERYWKEFNEARERERSLEAPTPHVRTPEEEEKLRQAGLRRLQMVKEAADRWWLELEQAKLEAKSPSPQYPRLAWLNGIWCSTAYSYTHTEQVRWQVVGPNALRRASFKEVLGATPFSETSFAVEKVIEDTYYLRHTSEGSFGSFTVGKGDWWYVTEIRKRSDDKHASTSVRLSLWKGKAGEIRSGTATFQRCIGRGSTRWPQSKTSAHEPARLDQPPPGLTVAPRVSVQHGTTAQQPTEAADRWWLELEQAKLEAKSPSPQYPRLAWLNGIWCRKTSSTQSRYQIVGPNELRAVSYYDGQTVLNEYFFTIDQKEGYFEKRSRARSDGGYWLAHIRKDSDDRYTRFYTAWFGSDGTLHSESKESNTTFRCGTTPG